MAKVKLVDPEWVSKLKLRQKALIQKQGSVLKNLIAKLMAVGGSVVALPLTGEPNADVLVRAGHKFRSSFVAVTTKASTSSLKRYTVDTYRKNPDRYRVCFGYALVEAQDVQYWIKHYWLYDKNTKAILDNAGIKAKIYFGVRLTASGVGKLGVR